MRNLIVAGLSSITLLAACDPSPAVATSGRRIFRTYATSYCEHGVMRDGSYTRPRSIASNFLPLGARIRLVGRSFFGMRRFVVRDTGGALFDGHVDVWSPSCATSIAWGRRPVSFHIGWAR